MKLYYEESGSGHPVIMMHGWTSSHEIYSEPVALLKDKARFIIYDHRGHGRSKEANKENVTMETLASDLHEIIEGLALSDVTLLGWSMGSGVAMNYVRLYGCSALKQVILCDMTPKQLNDNEWKLGLYQGKYTAQEMKRDAENLVSKYVNMSKSKMLNRNSAIPTAPNARIPHIHHVYRNTNPLKISTLQC